MGTTLSVPLLQRRLWIDWLRLAALFMVVCSHCCDPFICNPDPDACADARLGFWGALWQSALRPCVPLFSAWVAQASQRALANLTACGFGLYLVHYFFVGPAHLLVRSWETPIALVVPLSALLAFGVSWGVVALLRRLVPGAWFLG